MARPVRAPRHSAVARHASSTACASSAPITVGPMARTVGACSCPRTLSRCRPQRRRVTTYRAAEAYGVIWVNLGSGDQAHPEVRAARRSGVPGAAGGAIPREGERPAHRGELPRHRPLPVRPRGDPRRPSATRDRGLHDDDRPEGVLVGGRQGVSARPVRHRPRLGRDLHVSRASAPFGVLHQARRALVRNAPLGDTRTTPSTAPPGCGWR